MISEDFVIQSWRPIKARSLTILERAESRSVVGVAQALCKNTKDTRIRYDLYPNEPYKQIKDINWLQQNIKEFILQMYNRPKIIFKIDSISKNTKMKEVLKKFKEDDGYDFIEECYVTATSPQQAYMIIVLCLGGNDSVMEVQSIIEHQVAIKPDNYQSKLQEFQKIMDQFVYDKRSNPIKMLKNNMEIYNKNYLQLTQNTLKYIPENRAYELLKKYCQSQYLNGTRIRQIKQSKLTRKIKRTNEKYEQNNRGNCYLVIDYTPGKFIIIGVFRTKSQYDTQNSESKASLRNYGKKGIQLVDQRAKQNGSNIDQGQFPIHQYPVVNQSTNINNNIQNDYSAPKRPSAVGSLKPIQSSDKPHYSPNLTNNPKQSTSINSNIKNEMNYSPNMMKSGPSDKPTETNYPTKFQNVRYPQQHKPNQLKPTNHDLNNRRKEPNYSKNIQSFSNTQDKSNGGYSKSQSGYPRQTYHKQQPHITNPQKRRTAGHTNPPQNNGDPNNKLIDNPYKKRNQTDYPNKFQNVGKIQNQIGDSKTTQITTNYHKVDPNQPRFNNFPSDNPYLSPQNNYHNEKQKPKQYSYQSPQQKLQDSDPIREKINEQQQRHIKQQDKACCCSFMLFGISFRI